MPLSPTELATHLASGLLSFPVTHFADDLRFDEAHYSEHVAWMSGFDVAALFAAGGTGEFFSLTPEETGRVVRAAVAAADERVPVLAPAGYGTMTAIAQAVDAQRAGAAGILLFPPYLTESTQDGLLAHAKAVCDATDLGVVYYNRSNGVLAPNTVARLAEACPNFVALKDGIGDVETMTRVFANLRDRLVYIGGLPTAELFALPYLQLGLTTYSSALFNFVPEFALEFYKRVRAVDRDGVYELLSGFVLPYVEVRDRRKATAVPIVKAGLRAIDRPAGPVRPPLEDMTEKDVADLRALIAAAGSVA